MRVAMEMIGRPAPAFAAARRGSGYPPQGPSAVRSRRSEGEPEALTVGLAAVSNRELGGTYQYSLAILRALRALAPRIRTVVIEDGASRDVISAWQTADCQVVSFNPPTMLGRMRRGAARVLSGRSSPRSTAAIARSRAQWLRRHQIDVLLFPQPTVASFETGLPYVMAVPDLQHRLQPEFPEVSANGERETREYLFGNAIRYAEAVIVDSEVGREDVLTFYGDRISVDRIRVLPFVPPPYLARPSRDDMTVRLRSLAVTDRYLLMPAQFWPHKNHHRVVEAVAMLRKEHLNVTVVMTGSSSGRLRTQTLTEVQEFIARTEIDDLVRILGYVEDEAITALYAGATGVLLPTFFGPTNIPVIEGWAMGIPVLTSDIRGIREQCGDAALLVDPRSTEAIAEGIRRLWMDDGLRGRLVVAGHARLEQHDPADFGKKLERIIGDVWDGLAAGESRVRST